MKLMAAELRTAGAQRAYASWFGKIDPTSGEYLRDIVVTIDDYTDAAGATKGLELVTQIDHEGTSDIQVITGSNSFGDSSQITLYGATAADGETPSPWLDMKIRFGAMNVGISIFDYTGQVPEVAEIEALAQAALAKIERERDAILPDLSFHGLRLWPATYSFDGYVRRASVDEGFADESEEDWQVRKARYGSAIDVYVVGQFLASDDTIDFDSVPRVQNLLGQFASEDAASAYLAELPIILAAESGVADLTVRETDLDLGDETIRLTYTVPTADGARYAVDWVSIREGSMVSSVNVRVPSDAVGMASVDALANAAQDCLHSNEWCVPIPTPRDLLGRTSQATPVP